jgi:hypothetical protein
LMRGGGGNSNPFELTKPLTHIMVMPVLYTLGLLKNPTHQTTNVTYVLYLSLNTSPYYKALQHFCDWHQMTPTKKAPQGAFFGISLNGFLGLFAVGKTSAQNKQNCKSNNQECREKRQVLQSRLTCSQLYCFSWNATGDSFSFGIV